MIARLEGEQTALRAEQEHLKETLATNQVVSKEDFFDKLDLITFEGRHAANSLLKRLGVKASVMSEGPSQQWYRVNTETLALFLISHNSDQIKVGTFDSRILDLQEAQGEISAEEKRQLALAPALLNELAREVIKKLDLGNK